MNILLNADNLAFYIDQVFSVQDNCVILEDGSVNYSYNASNTTVINVEPPEYPVNFAYKWESNAWVCVNQDAVDDYNLQQKNKFNNQQKKKRFLAYTVESDPIFFKYQRGEATNQEWLDKIAEIDARFPYEV
jgi:outer membrane lipoprotein-sorting protein